MYIHTNIHEKLHMHKNIHAYGTYNMVHKYSKVCVYTIILIKHQHDTTQATSCKITNSKLVASSISV